MTEISANTLWESILDLCKNEFEEATISCWLTPLKAGTLGANSLELLAPNQFFASWIETNHKKKIQSLLTSLSAEHTQIFIKIDPNAPAPVQETRKPHPTKAQRSNAPLQTAFSSGVKSFSPDTTKNSYTQNSSSASNFATPLNPQYTFDGFVVYPNNHMAFASCQQILQSPGEMFNPIMIYGSTGLGKTHLIQSVAHKLKENSQYKVMYCSSEDFANHFIHSLRHKSLSNFHDLYRNVDILLIDDIQFFSGKKSTASEFFHTFKHLHMRNKQIIVTSDRKPEKIKDISEGLISRFTGGLIVSMKPPEDKAKKDLIEMKSQILHLHCSEEVINLLAKQHYKSVRLLESVLKKIQAYRQIYPDIPLTTTLVTSMLPQQTERKISSANSPRIIAEQILELVSQHYKIDKSEILSKKRTRPIITARYTALVLYKNCPAICFEDIRPIFNYNSDSYLHKALRTAKEWLEKTPRYQDDILKIEDQVNELF